MYMDLSERQLHLVCDLNSFCIANWLFNVIVTVLQFIWRINILRQSNLHGIQTYRHGFFKLLYNSSKAQSAGVQHVSRVRFPFSKFRKCS